MSDRSICLQGYNKRDGKITWINLSQEAVRFLTTTSCQKKGGRGRGRNGNAWLTDGNEGTELRSINAGQSYTFGTKSSAPARRHIQFKTEGTSRMEMLGTYGKPSMNGKINIANATAGYKKTDADFTLADTEITLDEYSNFYFMRVEQGEVNTNPSGTFVDPYIMSISDFSIDVAARDQNDSNAVPESFEFTAFMVNNTGGFLRVSFNTTGNIEVDPEFINTLVPPSGIIAVRVDRVETNGTFTYHVAETSVIQGSVGDDSHYRWMSGENVAIETFGVDTSSGPDDGTGSNFTVVVPDTSPTIDNNERMDSRVVVPNSAIGSETVPANLNEDILRLRYSSNDHYLHTGGDITIRRIEEEFIMDPDEYPYGLNFYEFNLGVYNTGASTVTVTFLFSSDVPTSNIAHHERNTYDIPAGELLIVKFRKEYSDPINGNDPLFYIMAASVPGQGADSWLVGGNDLDTGQASYTFGRTNTSNLGSHIDIRNDNELVADIYGVNPGVPGVPSAMDTRMIIYNIFYGSDEIDINLHGADNSAYPLDPDGLGGNADAYATLRLPYPSKRYIYRINFRGTDDYDNGTPYQIAQLRLDSSTWDIDNLPDIFEYSILFKNDDTQARQIIWTRFTDPGANRAISNGGFGDDQANIVNGDNLLAVTLDGTDTGSPEYAIVHIQARKQATNGEFEPPPPNTLSGSPTFEYFHYPLHIDNYGPDNA